MYVGGRDYNNFDSVSVSLPPPNIAFYSKPDGPLLFVEEPLDESFWHKNAPTLHCHCCHSNHLFFYTIWEHGCMGERVKILCWSKNLRFWYNFRLKIWNGGVMFFGNVVLVQSSRGECLLAWQTRHLWWVHVVVLSHHIFFDAMLQPHVRN